MSHGTSLEMTQITGRVGESGFRVLQEKSEEDAVRLQSKVDLGLFLC